MKGGWYLSYSEVGHPRGWRVLRKRGGFDYEALVMVHGRPHISRGSLDQAWDDATVFASSGLAIYAQSLLSDGKAVRA